MKQSQVDEAVALVKKHGSVAEAAKATGIPRKTLSDRYHAAATNDNKRIKELELLVEQQAARIERLSRPKRVLSGERAARADGDYYRVIIPDSHGSHADEQALAAFLGDLEVVADRVKEIVMLGDHIDCGGFLAQHLTLGYVAEASYTFEDDCAAANQFLDKITETCPAASVHYLEGNHERRIEKFCVTAALRSHVDAKYLRGLFSVEKVLRLSDRGVLHYAQGNFYHGVRIPATIKLGKCHFTHGSRTGANPAAAMLRDFGGNVVFGHVHRMDAYSSRTVNDGEIGAWCPGCLCRLQPLWNHTQITGWSHGYGLQLVREDGDFLHINVPIINGKSYLIQLTSAAESGKKARKKCRVNNRKKSESGLSTAA